MLVVLKAVSDYAIAGVFWEDLWLGFAECVDLF
jgi:hypothetical protein